MRPKQPKWVATFPTTTDAMAMERLCEARSLPGRLIPLPPIIHAECGMCWAAPPEAEEALRGAMEEAGVRCAGAYTLLL